MVVVQKPSVLGPNTGRRCPKTFGFWTCNPSCPKTSVFGPLIPEIVVFAQNWAPGVSPSDSVRKMLRKTGLKSFFG